MSMQAGGLYFSAAAQAVRVVILASLLRPSELGTVALVALVLAYAQYCDLGIALAVGRQIPVSLGAARDQEAVEWRWYGLAAKLLGSVSVGLVLVVIVTAEWSGLNSGVRFGLLTAAVVLVLQGVIMALQVVLQANQRFGRAAILSVTLGTANLTAGVAGAAADGLRGVFIGQVIAYAAAAVAGFVVAGRIIPSRLQMWRLRLLLRIGAPLAALVFAGYNLVNIDQVMVTSLLGRRDLGIYALVLYGGSALYLLPSALAGVVGPRLLRTFGEFGTVESIYELTWRPVRVLALAMPMLIIAFCVVGPLVIQHFLPAYSAAIAPLRIYSVGMFFLGLNLGVSTTLVAFNKHPRNIPIVVLSIGFNVAIDLVFVGLLHWGLMGIALGSALTYFVYWMSHTALVRWYFHQTPRRALLMNLKSGWQGLVLAAMTLAAWATGAIETTSLLSSALYLAGLLVFLPPILVTAMRRGHAIGGAGA
jgi:O-antigen/teichoic acid export membrane protein